MDGPFRIPPDRGSSNWPIQVPALATFLDSFKSPTDVSRKYLEGIAYISTISPNYQSHQFIMVDIFMVGQLLALN